MRFQFAYRKISGNNTFASKQTDPSHKTRKVVWFVILTKSDDINKIGGKIKMLIVDVKIK